MSRKWAVKEVDGKREKNIITGMIVSDRFLRDIQPIYDSNHMDGPFGRTVAGWCIDYWEQHQSAPKEHIEDIFQANLKQGMDVTMIDMTAAFLEGLNDDYEATENFNVDYIFDETVKYFQAKSLEALSDAIRGNLVQGNLTEAEECRNDYKPVTVPSAEGVNPFTNQDVIQDAIECQEEQLFTVPGDLGELLNEYLVRDAFVGLMSPEKRGKSWWLQELAMQAASQNCNVAFFSVGDMSEHQMVNRMLSRLTQKTYLQRQCGTLKVPVLDCVFNQDGSCDKKPACRESLVAEDQFVKDPFKAYKNAPKGYRPCADCCKEDSRNYKGSVFYEDFEMPSTFSLDEANKAGAKFADRMGRCDFKLATYSNSSVNVQAIRNQLDLWAMNEDFVPDVIVIDYADILAPEDGRMDVRHQQNDTWKALRRMSQDLHCLVITATQTDAASYDAGILQLKNFSEDKRKYAHVTAMLGINQTKKEKTWGVTRINVLLARASDYNPFVTVTCLQCLQMGRPLMASFYGRVGRDDEETKDAA